MNRTFLPSDGPSGPAKLSIVSLEPAAAEAPKAVVLIVHGMAEYKDRYLPFMQYLSEMGYACIAYDHRGHGTTMETKEDRGDFGKNGVEALTEDLLHVIRYARECYPQRKLFLLGHSMGSLIIRNLMKNHDEAMDGVILSGSPSKSPFNGLGILITRILQLFKGARHRSRTMAILIFGRQEKRYYKKEGIRNAWLCSNRAVVEAFNNDRLCGFKFTLRGYRTLLQLFARVYSDKGWNVTNPDLPIHFVSGGSDMAMRSLKAFSRSIGYLRAAGYRQVSSKVYPGMRHAVLNELKKEEVWMDVHQMFNSWL